MNPTDLAYAAGMLDGDGFITVNKGSRPQKNGSHSFMVTVAVAQKEDDILLWFAAMFGGRVRIVGKGKYTKDAFGKELFFPPMQRWELYCQNAANFLEMIVPYLRIKKNRAELAIKLARMQRHRGGNGYRNGGKEVTTEENEARMELALQIRSQNSSSNIASARLCKWGAN